MKRFFAIIVAISILVASVPAFAVTSRDWNSAGAYSGDISTLSSFSDISASLALTDLYSGEDVLIISQCVRSNQLTCAVFTNKSPYPPNGFFYSTYSGSTTMTYGTTNSTNYKCLWIPISTPLSAGFNPTSGSSWSRVASNNWSSGATYKINTTDVTQQSFWIDQSAGPLRAGDVLSDSVVIPWPVIGYSGPASITLQPGNLLIFERSGGFSGVPDIRILADNLPRSPLIGPWTTRNTIKSFDSLPDPTSVFVLPYLEWSAVPGTTDWLGRSSVGTASWQISQYTEDFAVFLNPIFGTDVSAGLLGDSSADYNPPNKVYIQNVADYDRIMLVSVVNRYGQSYIDYENGSILYDATFTDEGVPEFTPEGSDTPSSDANKPGGATDITGTPGGTTQGLIARILSFLESGIDRFASIADAGRSFIESIGDMFNWLPFEVRNILVSGIIIVIMMGVLSRFI